jgi:all-trans-8'-apo-beta-carotenal 15,15'-oxygenase
MSNASSSHAQLAAPPRRPSLSLLELLAKDFRTVADEVTAPIEITEGSVPIDLRGSLYRNTPGRLDRGGQPYGHLLDGDGMIMRFTFSHEGINYQNRFVRTHEFVAEERAGRILYRNFGTKLPGGIRKNILGVAKFKNAANTSVVWHGGRLLALWEGGTPWEIHPETLATVGPYEFGGKLRQGTSFAHRLMGTGTPFSAHPKIDPLTGELFNFGLVAGTRYQLVLYRADAQGKLSIAARVPLDGFAYAHDFILTRHHAVVLLFPLLFNPLRIFLGMDSIVSSAQFDTKRPTEVLVIPRAGGQARRFHAPPCFMYHLVNGYETEDQRLVIDGTWSERVAFSKGSQADLLADMRPHAAQMQLDLRSGRTDFDVVESYWSEWPSVNPRRIAANHRYVWSAASPSDYAEYIYRGVLKIDRETNTREFRNLEPGLPSEPTFVPRPGATREDDGWLVINLYDTDRDWTDLLVLNASDLSTVCRGRIPNHVPSGFHATWIERRSS